MTKFSPRVLAILLAAAAFTLAGCSGELAAPAAHPATRNEAPRVSPDPTGPTPVRGIGTPIRPAADSSHYVVAY